MKNFLTNKPRIDFKAILAVLLLLCLCSQVWYIIGGKNRISFAQQTPEYNDDRGGQSAPAPPGGNMQPPGQGGEPGQPGQQMEPPPGGQVGQPGDPQPGGANGGMPGQNPGGRVISYPSLQKGKEITPSDMQKLETYYILHRWVLSDLLWGLAELEKSDKYKLSSAQIKKILPTVKALHDEVEITEKSNKLIKNLLTDKQNEYIRKKLIDGSYMAQFLARYTPGESEPFQGVSKTALEKCIQVLDKKIKESGSK
jgi:hypothetical protein